jgi:protoheme IX farnesyltransferase
MRALNIIIKQLKIYYQITKPQRTLSNVLTAIAGLLFAAELAPSLTLFLALTIGIGLVIASACTFNNIIDKRIDKIMNRTKKRALPAGKISTPAAIIYAAIIGIIGFFILTFTNWLTVSIISIAFIGYVAVYAYAKRHSAHSTLIGTIPGGASLVAGYTSFTNQLDQTAAILFLIMASWQMVHFYAITIYRLKDYKQAKIPVMPYVAGIKRTKIIMFIYLLLFLFVADLLTWTDRAGYVYLAGVNIVGIFWLLQVMRGFGVSDNNAWAKSVFKSSLIVLAAVSFLIAFGSVLP